MRTVPDPCCYMVAAGKYVKIGFTDDLDRRVAQMQTGCPYKLKVMAKLVVPSVEAARNMEAELHKRFEKYRFRG